MSQADLSSSSGVSQGNISKLENGLIDSADDVVEMIASALNFPSSLFHELDRIYGLPVSVHPMYRKRSSVGQRSLDKLEAELNLRLMHVRRLLKSSDLSPEFSLPELDIEDYGSPEEIANLVRRTWLLPSGPLSNLVESVERAGCIVSLCDFSNKSVDGVTVNAPGTPPCIFLNRNQPADRQRFSLAHELGHIVMHRVPTPTMEDEANKFASELLLPSKEVKPHLTGKLTIQRLAALKPMWRVSMQALLFKAGELNCITANQKKYLWIQMSRSGYRRQEPKELDFPPEQPLILPELIRIHLEDLGYKISDLSRFLHVYEDDMLSMHPFPAKESFGALRLVK